MCCFCARRRCTFCFPSIWQIEPKVPSRSAHSRASAFERGPLPAFSEILLLQNEPKVPSVILAGPLILLAGLGKRTRSSIPDVRRALARRSQSQSSIRDVVPGFGKTKPMFRIHVTASQLNCGNGFPIGRCKPASGDRRLRQGMAPARAIGWIDGTNEAQ
jgi:hypothetical protein